MSLTLALFTCTTTWPYVSYLSGSIAPAVANSSCTWANSKAWRPPRNSFNHADVSDSTVCTVRADAQNARLVGTPVVHACSTSLLACSAAHCSWHMST
eukprot:357516-Chlamydomonas_euryale.AAC.22